MRLKIFVATIGGMFLFLLILHGIRIGEGYASLRERMEMEGKEYAFLLGEIAEGLYMDESLDAIQVRLERSAKQVGIPAVAYDSELERDLAVVGDFGEFKREMVEHDTTFSYQKDLIIQKYMPDSGTAIWVKVRPNLKSIVKREVKFFVLGAIFFGIVAVILSFVLDTIAVRPIKTVAKRLREIGQGGGDLTQRMRIESKDEIGALANAFDQLMEHLQTLVKQIVTTADEVTDDITNLSAVSEEVNASSQQVVMTIQEIASGAQKQSEETDGVFKGSEAVSEFADSVYQSAHETQEIAKMVRLSATSGEESMIDVTSRITEISKVSQQAMGIVKELRVKSRRIQSIVKAIDDISRQVNLLALNAAIEAAHAGEHGRGFGVVAEEIRRLAAQTDEATQQIAEIINEMERSTLETVQQTDIVTTKVKEGEKAIQTTSSILKNIASETGRSVTAIQNISQLTSQQKEMVLNLVQGLESIARVSEANASSAEEVSASSEEQTASMEEIAANIQSVQERVTVLADLVKKFKV